jgi:uncharacterized protein (TIGR00251 family)
MTRAPASPTPNTPDFSAWPCIRLSPGKGAAALVILDVSVSPNAKRTEVVGWHDGALRLRLSAPPVDGAANEALRKWLSQELGIPQNRIELLRGASGRRKQWSLDIAPDDMVAWLAAQPSLK